VKINTLKNSFLSQAEKCTNMGRPKYVFGFKTDLILESVWKTERESWYTL